MNKTQIFQLITVFMLIFAACSDTTGDVLVVADGRVIEGNLLSISSGNAVFSSGSIEIAEQGRIWCNNGNTFTGEISASSGIFIVGSTSIPVDSIYLVVWGGSAIAEETFAVDAALGWLDTGIELNEGEMLSMHGSGTVVLETGISTPHGQEKFSSSVALVPSATSGQLVFRIGEEGQPVAAGASWIGESPEGGSLFLGVNVPLSGSSSSHGVYTVTVKAGVNTNQHGSAYFYPARN